MTSIMNNESIEELYDVKRDTLTASHMLYWMAAARVGYIIAAQLLQRTSPAYQRSSKQLNLANYYLQLFVYTPALGILIWATFAIHNNNLDTVELGIRLFSNVAMLLLAMYSMELFIRGHLMDVPLIFHHVLLIIITLYVLSEDSSIDDPRDLIVFGVIDGIAAMNEQPTWIAMIHYRHFSDTEDPALKEGQRSKVLWHLRSSLSTFAFTKVGLVVSSLAWYAIRFDDIKDSNLVWIVPALRFVHFPAPAWSFYVQYQLYLRVLHNKVQPALSEEDSEAALTKDPSGTGPSPAPKEPEHLDATAPNGVDEDDDVIADV